MKVYVKHFSGDSYTVSYAKHWWSPTWTLMEMRNLGLTALTPAWTVSRLFGLNEATRVANKLKDGGLNAVCEYERQLRASITEFETRRKANLKARRDAEVRL